MYSFIKGKLSVKTPTFAVLEAGGIGYHIHISLHTYDKISDQQEAKLYTYLSVREDDLSLYGFFDEHERAVFQKLISVSGIGTNTARTILSTLSADEVEQAILSGNDALLKSVKGIGAKTAQRMVLELQDQMKKGGVEVSLSGAQTGHRQKAEALDALVMLGFSKPQAEKALASVMRKEGSDLPTEQLIKLTLKSI